MAILDFVIHLAGATMMLLFGVHLVKTGVERAFGPRYRSVISAQRNTFMTGFIGVGMAIILQSSAAVALMSSGFAAGGALAIGPATALIVGADLGSAIVVRILSFPIDRVLPFLLLVGGWLFLRTERKAWRATGRAILGIAVILIALRFISDAAAPISHTPVLPLIAGYLETDLLSAFIIGVAIAFTMHSSVAAILLFAALVEQGTLGHGAGIALALGANAGSALVPVWLTRSMPIGARRGPVAVMAVRIPFAIVMVSIVAATPLMAHLPNWASGATLVVTVHLVFNLLFFLFALPLCPFMSPIALQLMPEKGRGADVKAPPWQSPLNPEHPGTATQAVAALKRELLHMSELVTAMFRHFPALYDHPSAEFVEEVRLRDRLVNDCLERIRIFVSSIPHENLSKAEKKAMRAMMEYAIRLESAGDVVAKRICDLAEEKLQSGVHFSEAGRAEVRAMYEACLANVQLANDVLISDDVESARQLSAEKTEVKNAEYRSRKRHLARLRAQNLDSLASSDLHLETLRALREYNSHIAAVAYPLLYKNGLLRESRLVETDRV